jgi:hypothetical protein
MRSIADSKVTDALGSTHIGQWIFSHHNKLISFKSFQVNEFVARRSVHLLSDVLFKDQQTEIN